ncbi:MAG: ATP-binding protein [Bacteroidales bacterium]|nr:ATP-binding protein [Bacteroidales bacterium]
MERKVEKKLLEWKNRKNRLPLVLQGARQVGKTYSLLKFGKNYFKHIAYFNFESSTELHRIFDRNLTPSRIIRELSAYSAVPVVPEDTLIVFDEIQTCERALTSLKYFAEEASQYCVVAAGSLLGIAIKRSHYSFPVGKVELMTMFPMDMEEFLRAQKKDEAVSLIRECYSTDTFCNLHDTFMDEYRKFTGVGGMPQVVGEYVESGDYNLVVALQKNITDAHVADMAKYAEPAETVRILAAYNSIPAQLAKENKKFQYKTIRTGARATMYASALEWLVASATVNKCVKISQGLAPLKLYADDSSFKIYLADTGLLCSKYGIPPAVILNESHAWQSVKGILAENSVANVLTSGGYAPCYWESQGKAEVDFVIQNHKGEVIPIEVKSSEHARSKSLQQFVTRYKPPLSIRVSEKNFGFENRIKSVPLYASFCI